MVAMEHAVKSKSEWVILLNGDDSFDEGLAEMLDPSIQVDLNEDGECVIHFSDGIWEGFFND
jgi:hypothetical protein